MGRLTQGLRRLALVLLSALAMWAAFPEPALESLPSLWFLAPISVALLVAAIDRVGPWRGAGYAALWAMAFFVPHISWMNVATGGVYLAWILLAAAQAFFLGLWGLFFAGTGAMSWARTWWGEAIAASVLWVGIEQLRSRVPFGGFPWAKLAYSQVDAPLIGLAPLAGEVIVSGACVVVAVWLRLAFSRAATAGAAGLRGPRGRVLLAASAALLYLAPAAISLPTAPQSGTALAAAIQGNVEIPMFETYSVEGKVAGNHLRETLRMVDSGARPDVIFWGEDSIDRDPNVNSVTAGQVQQALDASGVPLVAGYQEYTDGVRYNWIGVWYPPGFPSPGQSEARYAKQHPVPWGEFVPWRSFSEILAVEAAQVSVDMVAADNPGYLEVTLGDGRVLPIAVGICFEAADEPILAEGVRLGGQMLLIPTNNSHFRYSAESDQQLQMLQFRAAEFARAGLQVSTNGVSAFVSPDGSITQITGKQVAAHLVQDVPLRSELTPAARLGEVPALVMIWTSLVGGAVALLWRRVRR